MPLIDGERLLEDLDTLRAFGARGNGVVRPSLSATDVASREWLCERIEAAGLAPSIDGVGTVFGRWPGAGPTVLIGSHTDTQPEGGWLDGAMGVIYGLEIARAFAEHGFEPGGIDVASWMDEEATFTHFVGARSFCDLLPDAEIAASSNADGLTLAAALEQAGYAGRPRLRHEPERQIAYLEAHIEQGGRLETADKRIGVVTAIVGIREFRVTFQGQQNHAGTTPMAIRRDATLALIQFAQQLHHAFQNAAAPDTVWNFGRIDVNPGAVAIVAREAQLSLQIRDARTEVLDRLEAVLYDLVNKASSAGPVAVRAESMLDPVAPAAMDEALQSHLAGSAARYAPDKWLSMPSGAGHDAQVLAGVVPSGMLFVPSINGISHSFDEDTTHEDIVLGCQVLADAAASILKTADTMRARPLSKAAG